MTGLGADACTDSGQQLGQPRVDRVALLHIQLDKPEPLHAPAAGLCLVGEPGGGDAPGGDHVPCPQPNAPPGQVVGQPHQRGEAAPSLDMGGVHIWHKWSKWAVLWRVCVGMGG